MSKLIMVIVIHIYYSVQFTATRNKYFYRIENNLTKDQLQPFLSNPPMRERVDNVLNLPEFILERLHIAVIKNINSRWNYWIRIISWKFYDDFLTALNKVKHLEKCFDYFETNTSILVLYRDHFELIALEATLRKTNYIHPTCINANNPYQCTKDYIYKVLYYAPIFMFGKRVGLHLDSERYFLDFNKPLLPDPYMLNGSKNIREFQSAKLQSVKWENKLEMIFWRGLDNLSSLYLSNKIECTNDAYNGRFPRIGLIMQTYLRPYAIDAKFSKILSLKQCRSNLYKFVHDNLHFCFNRHSLNHKLRRFNKEFIYLKPIVDSFYSWKSVKFVDHLHYKYLVSVDGWNAAWRRVPLILGSNSLLIKQESDIVQWFYGDLIKGYHFVEIPYEFKLRHFIKWAKENDEAAREIAQNGIDFYNKYLLNKKIRNTLFTNINDYLIKYNS